MENESRMTLYKIQDFIFNELCHVKYDDISWNEEFYTNDELDYQKICIKLLEDIMEIINENKTL